VLLFPGREVVLTWFPSVRDDQAGASVAAVGNHRGAADSCLGAGQFPHLAVVAVAGDRLVDGDDETGVGVDDDLVVRGVPIVLLVLRLLGDCVSPGHPVRHGDVERQPIHSPFTPQRIRRTHQARFPFPETGPDLVLQLSGWRDLNPRPLRPELGPGGSSTCALGQICRSGRWEASVSVGASGIPTQDHLQEFSKPRSRSLRAMQEPACGPQIRCPLAAPPASA
jgi:hypothetical protein